MQHHGTSRRLYFAYGSNLSKKQMSKRCPDTVTLRPFELLGWKLVFRRTADIVPAFGQTALGALYSITPKDELALDRYEGVSRGKYRRESIRISTNNHALTYVMAGSRPEEAPSTEYYGLIEQGFADWKWPISGLELARVRTFGHGTRD